MDERARPVPGDLCARTAREMASLVQERQVSPVELVSAHLERIAAIDPALGAFQVVRANKAVAEAAALAERADLADLPLAGVPVAIKDNVDVAGEPTRMGSAATPPSPAEADDELVARLRAAGCVVIGKTQLPELAIWPFTEPAAAAATRNPWNRSRTPGGSTGGGAAAVAAGLAAIALGSDGGGSIRIPAACCGLFGLKPAPGLVPLSGGLAEHWLGLSAFGPLARTVADAALMLDVLAGTTSYRDPNPPERPLRIAFSARHPLVGARADQATRAALDEAAGLLRDAGHDLVPQSPPYPPTLGLRFNSRWLAGIAQDASGLDRSALEPRTRKMAALGARLSSRARPASADRFASQAADWFTGYDVLMTPTLTRTARPVGTWDGKGWVATMLSVANWIYTPPWNLAGLPAASVPFGQDEDGVPIGLQLVGPAGSEATLLSLASQIEHLRPWPRLAPSPGVPSE
ncbi:MAG TPA: amidase family protein [Streptosporangiaceae bacterium]|nr:amidase family protein [Streptosporangiaceae bacterium]